MIDMSNVGWLEFYGMQRKNGHGLLVDRGLNHGVKEQRRFKCKCGEQLGTSFDNAAIAAFRAHHKLTLTA